MKTFTKAIRLHKIDVKGFSAVYLALSVIVSLCVVLMFRFEGELSQAAIAFDMDTLFGFLTVMAVIMVIKTIASAANTYLQGRFEAETGYKMRGNFAAHFLRARFADVTEKNSGEVLSVFSNDMAQSVKYVSSSVFTILADVLNELILLIYMFTIQPVYTLIFILLIPALVILQVKISEPINKKAMAMSGASQEHDYH